MIRSGEAALLCAARPHGEHGVVAHLLTHDHGLIVAYVAGGRSRQMRPLLMPGNQLSVELRSAPMGRLAGARVELLHSRAALLGNPLATAATEWVTGLMASVLPEGHRYPRLYDTAMALFDALEFAPGARLWMGALVRFELILLAELGFGLDLSECAVTGERTNLVAVSPRTGRAVGAATAQAFHAGTLTGEAETGGADAKAHPPQDSHGESSPRKNRLLDLPEFLKTPAAAPVDWKDALTGLRLTDHFIARDLLAGHHGALLATRTRLIDRIARATPSHPAVIAPGGN